MRLWYKIVIKVIVWLILASTTVISVGMTNAGLQVSIFIASKFIPGKLSIESIDGTWLSSVKLANIKYKHHKHTLYVQDLDFSIIKKHITINKVTGIENFIPETIDKDTSIDNFTAIASYSKEKKKWITNFNARGVWNNKPAKFNITISLDSLSKITAIKEITIEQAAVNVANNILTIKTHPLRGYQFNLQIYNLNLISKELSGDLHAKATLKNINDKLILEFKTNSKHIGYDKFEFHQMNWEGSLSTNDPHYPIRSSLKIAKIHLFEDKLNNFTLNVNGNMVSHKIYSHCNFLDNEISYHAKSSLKDKIWEAHSDDPSNHTSIKFNFNDSSKLDGFIKLSLNDFSQIGELLPKVTRVKAKMNSIFNFKGTYDKPRITAHAQIIDITATIPSMGVKIKPMTINLEINEKHRLLVDVYGKMRRGAGEFKLTGFMDLDDPTYRNEFKLKGIEVEFIKTNKKHLIANADLTLQYYHLKDELHVSGDIEILDGFLLFDDSKTIVKSQDIVYTDNRVNKTTKNIKIIPNIYIRIENPLHIKGFNLDGEITGKLLVTYENDNLYGSGRITIKKGTYSLPGKKLTIERGRLIYPQGTLLGNPLLDIKMIKLKSIDKNVIDAGIFLSGTARNPIISDVGITDSDDHTVELLNLIDVGIVKNNAQSSDFFSENIHNPDTHDKSFFIGSQLSDKIYLQYQRDLQNAINTVTIKHALTDNVSIGFDTGNQINGSGGLGAGADVSFSIEKD